MSCIFAGHANIVSHLVENGADMNARDRITYKTPLMTAIENGML